MSKLEGRRPIFYKRRRGPGALTYLMLSAILLIGGALAIWRFNDLPLVMAGKLPACDSVQAQSRFTRWIDSLPDLLGPKAVTVSVNNLRPADSTPNAQRCVADLRVGLRERQVRFDIVPGTAGERFALHILPAKITPSTLEHL